MVTDYCDIRIDVLEEFAEAQRTWRRRPRRGQIAALLAMGRALQLKREYRTFYCWWYYRENSERLRSYRRRWRRENLEHRLSVERRWRERNRDRIRERERAYNDKPEAKAYKRDWRAKKRSQTAVAERICHHCGTVCKLQSNNRQPPFCCDLLRQEHRRLSWLRFARARRAIGGIP